MGWTVEIWKKICFQNNCCSFQKQRIWTYIIWTYLIGNYLLRHPFEIKHRWYNLCKFQHNDMKEIWRKWILPFYIYHHPLKAKYGTAFNRLFIANDDWNILGDDLICDLVYLSNQQCSWKSNHSIEFFLSIEFWIVCFFSR